MDVSGSFEAGEVPSDAICVDDAESTDEFETQLENAVAEGRDRIERQTRRRGRPATASCGSSGTIKSRPATAAHRDRSDTASTKKSLRDCHSASTNAFEDVLDYYNSAKRASSRERLPPSLTNAKKMRRPASAVCLRVGSAKSLRRPVSASSKVFGVARSMSAVPKSLEGTSLSRVQSGALRRSRSSAEYIRMYEAKQREEQLRLAALIEKTNHEAEFALLRKMTEVNRILQSERDTGEAIVYKMLETPVKVTGAGGEKIGCYVGSQLVGKLSVDAFERKYKALMSSKTDTNLPPAGSSSPIDKSALVQTRLSPAEQANRQSEIRKILIQTMRLTSKLREQLKVVKESNPHARRLCESLSDGIGFAPFVVEG